MCYLSSVQRAFVPLAIVTLLALGCSAEVAPDHQSEWRDVLQHKKAAVSAEASPRDKQAYADSVSAFLRRHPNHSRAHEVYRRIQLEFASDLAALGRHQDAIRFYRAVLAHDPDNETAQRGLAQAIDQLAVSREKLLQLEKGMSHRQVAQILGKPVPGWTVEKNRAGAVTEAWYYRTTSGGVAGVYFREGKVFAAEENSQAKIGL
ncbi:MAG TPA: tetratricopeptide repeat protein [Thermoanaerobaculia bacterium]|nr:tetratricopeptide repeat protein [Thermoanaerobaculia bacterium]